MPHSKQQLLGIFLELVLANKLDSLKKNHEDFSIFADMTAPNSNSQYRFLRPISMVLLCSLQGLNQDQSLNCI